jgi:Xaa-Pro aminopeptidase
MSKIEKIQLALKDREFDAILLTHQVNRLFVTGFDSSAGALFITSTDAWFFTDSRYFEAAQAAISGAHVTLINRNLSKEDQYKIQIGALVEKHNIGSVGIEEKLLTYFEYTEWAKNLKAKLVPIEKFIIDMRAVKSKDELEKMKKAQRISEKAFEETLPLIKPGITEKEIAAELVYRMLKGGADTPAFKPIVVSGSKSSYPHGTPADVEISNGFLTMDFGARVNGWCSDTTRTVCVGKPTDEMIKVYDTVLEAQLASLDYARAGILGRELDAAARNVITNAGFAEYFGHSLGHSIGLEVHELPSAAPTSEDMLPVGAVLTMEPGIYLPGRFGVRIEDTICLHENGNENITSLAKTLLVL